MKTQESKERERVQLHLVLDDIVKKHFIDNPQDLEYIEIYEDGMRNLDAGIVNIKIPEEFARVYWKVPISCTHP